MTEETRTESHRSYLLVVMAISILFVLMEFLCQPYGNFPLNDDWSYARVAKTLLDAHRLTVTPWTLSASITPVVIGALFCSIFGFSFEILRVLTLVANLLLLATTGYLMKQLELSPKLICLGIATLLMNPLIFCLSNSFMTDVPALSLLLCACCFYYRYFKGAGMVDLFAATILSCAVCLTRQVLIVAPMSFLLVGLVGRLPLGKTTSIPELETNELSNELSATASAATATASAATTTTASAATTTTSAATTTTISSSSSSSSPSFTKSGMSLTSICLLALPASAAAICIFAHHLWLLHIGGPPFCYEVEQTYLRQQFSQGFAAMSLHVLIYAVIALVYLGLFLLPVLAGCIPGLLAARQAKERIFLLVLSLEIAVLLSAGFLWRHSLMPLADNVIFDIGLGPVLLPGSKGPTASSPFWLVVTVMSSFGTGILLAYLVPALKKRLRQLCSPASLSDRDRFMLFTWCFLVLYLFIICLRGFFDRYLIVAMPFLIFVIGDIARKQPEQVVLAQNGELDSSSTTLAAGLTQASDLVPEKSGAAYLAACLAICFCLMLGTFSTLAVHDYFSWNRARWQALGYLIDKQAAIPRDINGGLEINGWLSSDPQTGAQVPTNNGDLSRGDTFAIALVKVPNYHALAQFSFSRWLFRDNSYIFALKKNADY